MVWRESPCLSVEAGDPGARRIQGFLAEPLCAVGSSTAASDTLQIVKGESLTILPPQSMLAFRRSRVTEISEAESILGARAGRQVKSSAHYMGNQVATSWFRPQGPFEDQTIAQSRP